MAGKWKYEIIIYWSEEDDACIAEVPELPGWAAARGIGATPRDRWQCTQ